MIFKFWQDMSQSAVSFFNSPVVRAAASATATKTIETAKKYPAVAGAVGLYAGYRFFVRQTPLDRIEHQLDRIEADLKDLRSRSGSRM